MLEELLKANKISSDDAEIYQLFACTVLGQKWLKRLTHETFMEEIPKEYLTGQRVAFADGRRSTLRQIHYAIDYVNSKIKEQEHDNTGSDIAG